MAGGGARSGGLRGLNRTFVVLKELLAWAGRPDADESESYLRGVERSSLTSGASAASWLGSYL